MRITFPTEMHRALCFGIGLFQRLTSPEARKPRYPRALGALSLLLGLALPSYGQHPVQINEIRINQPGADDDEYFELIGPPGFSLTPYTYVVIGDDPGGNSGVIESAIPLSGLAINAQGFFVAAEKTFTLGVPDLEIPLNHENSDNVTHLLVEGFFGSLGQDLDLDDDCVLDVAPWATILDGIAVILEPNPPVNTECHYGPPTVGPDDGFAPGHVHRCPDRTGPFVIATFALGIDDTPGTANSCPSLYEPGTQETPFAVPNTRTPHDGAGTLEWTIAAHIERPPALPLNLHALGPTGANAPLPSSGPANVLGNDCWGWTDPSRQSSQGRVYGFSGEFVLSALDCRIPGRSLATKIGRKYRSRALTTTSSNHGWDHSYNIRIVLDGADVIVWDGNTRRDRYSLQLDGTWARPEFFRVLRQDVDGSFVLTFPDAGEWRFLSLDDATAPGQISAIVDRNGNAIMLEYVPDPSGSTTRITDDLGRQTELMYDSSDRLYKVVDFSLREVSYEYYQAGDKGGCQGDLKSVTTPPVLGTPNGNDFPNGKTTTYTYTCGFADERLNHDLRTIKDPKGQTFLVNEYAHTISGSDLRSTTDPEDLHFDRLVRQILGDLGDIIDYFYVELTPDQQNNFASVKMIVNDRVGNVSEHFYNKKNRLVMTHEYTGRAPNPDTVTTDILNRPINPLRNDDPLRFETRYAYNDDAKLTRVVHPNGNERTYLYDETAQNRRSQGNLLQHCRNPGPLGGDQPQICEAFEYEEGLGGCCGVNFVTRHTDGRGHETLHEYDDSGNRTRTIHRLTSIVEDFEYNVFGQLTAHILPDNGSGHRRRDEFHYYPSGSQMGNLREAIIDAENLALTTTHSYDDVGNLIAVTDPAGHETQYVVNELNQVVRTLSPEVTLPNGTVRYERDAFYDANDNVVRIDIQNIDDQGDLSDNTHLTTIFEYDILNNVVRRCEESGSYLGAIPGPPELPTCEGLPDSEFITTEYHYDANRNLTLVLFGEATEGRQLNNTIATSYDERDLPFQVTRALGDPAQSTDQNDYDGNRNLRRTAEGLEAEPRITLYSVDGYDRQWAIDERAVIDPMGNWHGFHYDANGNVVRTIQSGELTDVDGSQHNVRLFEVTNEHDAMDRRTREIVEFFDPETQSPIFAGGTPDGLVTTETFWSDNSQVTRIVDDNLHEKLFQYDTANRVSQQTDAKGNKIMHTYDSGSRAVCVTTLERSDLGNPDEIYKTTNVYDALDRMITTIDNMDNTNQFGYDSRSNKTLLRDALAHEIRFVFDGINRKISTIRDLDGDGADGDGTDITTGRLLDDTSRVVAQIDDNGNATTIEHDPLSRPVRVIFADGTQTTTTFDVHDNVLTFTDANGSLVSCNYDRLNRLQARSIKLGPTVSGSTFEVFSYDGASRPVLIQDDDSSVLRSYDSLSHVTREVLNGQTTTRLYDGTGNAVRCIYPSGRTIDCSYDELDRKNTITQGGEMIASYTYVGPERVERLEFGNGTRSIYTYDGLSNMPGDFGVKKPVIIDHRRAADGFMIEEREYGWDRMQNKVLRVDVRNDGARLRHDYSYDSVYRLIDNVVTGGDDPMTQIIDLRQYKFDGVGNRESVAGRKDPGPYTLSSQLNEPADSQTNQYTETPFDRRIYDRNGNLTRIRSPRRVANRNAYWRPGRTHVLATYDYRNQLVAFHDRALGIDVQYAYDALGRRIERRVNGVSTRYLYDGWQVCEEQDEFGQTEATYVYGLGLDEVLSMRRAGQDYFYHADDVGTVLALTDGNGEVVERRMYGDFGEPLDPDTLEPLAMTIDPSTVGNPYGFTGRRHDPESGWIYCRYRYLDPRAGRFVTRDPAGYGPNPLLNLFTWAMNRPTTLIDPMGLGPIHDDYKIWLRCMILAALECVHYPETCNEGHGCDYLKPSVPWETLGVGTEAPRPCGGNPNCGAPCTRSGVGTVQAAGETARAKPFRYWASVASADRRSPMTPFHPSSFSSGAREIKKIVPIQIGDILILCRDDDDDGVFEECIFW